MKLGNKLSGC